MSTATLAVAAVAVALSALAPVPVTPPLPALPAPSPQRAVGSPLDAALGAERSLLAFLPAHVTSGEYSFARGQIGFARPAPRHRGVFWRTPAGNVYTRTAPYDRALVAREVDALAERVRAEHAGVAERSRLERMVPLAGNAEPYRGDEFQYPFEQFVYELALHPDHGHAFSRPRDPDCDQAHVAHEAAARRAVARTAPRFVPSADGTETWALDIPALRDASKNTRDAAERACADSDNADPSGPVTVTVVRTADGVTFTAEGDVRSNLAEKYVVTVRPGPVGPPPDDPEPAPAVHVVNDFLLAVNACGALPWEYVDFAAANDYDPPSDKSYDGPTVFSTEWFCERDVPVRDRTREDG